MGFILCPSCGYLLADKYDIYIKARDNKIKSKYGENVNMKKLDLDPEFEVLTNDILDALNITSICCRTHMITLTEFKDTF